MELTTKQQKGLGLAIERYRNHQKYTVISGYAGSGKSTLVKFIIDALAQDGLNPEREVVFATPTGKAAVVLQSKGNKNVSTIHKLLYDWKPLGNGKFKKTPVEEIPYKVVVVDECSMVSIDMVTQLLKYNTYVIFLGDPGQLPPINKNDDNHLLDIPHIFLDEIMRQAMDSEIIRLTLAIRENKPIIASDYGKEVMVVKPKDLSTGMLSWADQILCATNRKRNDINSFMRQLLGREGAPQPGDKVISLRNEWETLDNEGSPLINGTIGYLQNPKQAFFYTSNYFGHKRIDVTQSNLITETNSTFKNLGMDTHMILTGEKCIPDPKLAFRINNSTELPYEFSYAYAITCHKAQGSEWNKVLVLEENFPYKEEHKNWLYTACTRASEKLVLVQKG